MKQMKKILCGVLMVCMIVAGITIVPQNVNAATEDFVIENGVLIEYKGAGGKVVIPDGVTEIADRVFFYNDTITNITVPDSVTKCGSRCFGACTSLKEITFKNPDTVLDWDSMTQNHDLKYGAFYAGDYWEVQLSEVKPMAQTLTIKGYSGSTAETLAKSYAKYPWGNMTVKFVNLKNKKVATYGIPTTLSIKKVKQVINVKSAIMVTLLIVFQKSAINQVIIRLLRLVPMEKYQQKRKEQPLLLLRLIGLIVECHGKKYLRLK